MIHRVKTLGWKNCYIQWNPGWSIHRDTETMVCETIPKNSWVVVHPPNKNIGCKKSEIFRPKFRTKTPTKQHSNVGWINPSHVVIPRDQGSFLSRIWMILFLLLGGSSGHLVIDFRAGLMARKCRLLQKFQRSLHHLSFSRKLFRAKIVVQYHLVISGNSEATTVAPWKNLPFFPW